MFLIRTAFWLALVIMLIPTGHNGTIGDGTTGDGTTGGEQAGLAISPFAAIDAARHTMSDLAGFCDRNPDTCQTGAAIARTFGEKAQTGALMVYEYLSESDLSIETGSTTRSAAAPRRAIDTLSVEDRELPWQGPDGQS